MADSVCGPSTALKSFSEHTNRDRSLHQDRSAAIPGRPSPSNFRSLPAGPSNDAEVRAFAAGTPTGLQPEIMPMPSALDMSMAGPPAFQSRMAHPPPMPGIFAPPIAQSGLAMGRVSTPNQTPMMHTNWAAEFSATQQGIGRASPAGLQSSSPAPNLATAGFGGLPQQQNMMLLQEQQQRLYQQQSMYQQLSMQGPALFNTYQPQPSYVPNIPMTQKHQPPTTASPAVAQTGVAGISEAELEARFAQIEADADFQSEMDTWMATYGPSAEERQAQPQPEQQSDLSSKTSTTKDATTDDPSASQREINNASEVAISRLAEGLEAQKLATDEAKELQAAEAAMAADQERARQNEELKRQQEEQEKQRQKDGDELARTAEKIVGVLDSHPASRFRESNFINLMRRIQNREVVVRGEDLIDENTGEPVKVAVNNKDGSADPGNGNNANNANNESSPAPA